MGHAASGTVRRHRSMPVLFGQAAFDDRADSLHQGVAGDKIFWLNWLMENDRDLARLDRVAAFRHDVMRADYRHRHYRDPALHCQVERAFFEGQEFAVERALPFHIDGHGHSVFHNSFGPANGFDAGVAVGAIYWHELAHTHGASENGNFEEFLLDHDGSLPRNQRDFNRRVEIGNVVGHEDVALGMIKALQTDGLDADSGEPDSGTCSPHEQCIENFDAAGEESDGKSNQGRDWGADGPEGKHDGGADHGAPVPVAVWASPLSHAARRTRCSLVT